MSVSSIGSSSATYQTQLKSGPSSEIREGIKALKEAADSGDLTKVQSAYDSLSKLASSDSSASDSNSPLSKILSSVADALKTGDISQVQSALQPPKDAAQGGQGAGGPQGGPPPDGGQPPSKEVTDALGQLGTALQSGDLDAAQTAYSTLTDALGEDSSSSSDDSTETSDSASSTSTTASDLETLLKNLGSALESGNLSSAQSLFSSLTPRGSQGVDTYA